MFGNIEIVKIDADTAEVFRKGNKNPLATLRRDPGNNWTTWFPNNMGLGSAVVYPDVIDAIAKWIDF